MNRADMLARLRTLDRALAEAAFARRAEELLRGRTHELGNHVQIVRLASLELEKRCTAPDAAEFITDLRASAERATELLFELLAAARTAPRSEAGPPVAPIVRVVATECGAELVCSLPDDARCYCRADELEGLVLAALLDTTRPRLELRARKIEGKPWLQLLCIGSRDGVDPLIEAIAVAAGGEATCSPGRDGTELAVELPLAL